MCGPSTSSQLKREKRRWPGQARPSARDSRFRRTSVMTAVVVFRRDEIVELRTVADVVLRNAGKVVGIGRITFALVLSHLGIRTERAREGDALARRIVDVF